MDLHGAAHIRCARVAEYRSAIMAHCGPNDKASFSTWLSGVLGFGKYLVNDDGSGLSHPKLRFCIREATSILSLSLFVASGGTVGGEVRLKICCARIAENNQQQVFWSICIMTDQPRHMSRHQLAEIRINDGTTATKFFIYLYACNQQYSYLELLQSPSVVRISKDPDGYRSNYL